MQRLATAIASAALAVLALAVFAQAASVRQPPTGPWEVYEGAGGFTLKKGKGKYKGKVLLSNLRLTTNAIAGCPSAPTTVRAIGSFPLKKFTRGGYTAWGVGRNEAGDVGFRPGKVEAEGKTFDGGFYVVWDSSDPTRVIGGGVRYGSCSTELSFASPK